MAGYLYRILTIFWLIFPSVIYAQESRENFQVLNAKYYQQIFQASRAEIQQLQQALLSQRGQALDQRITYLAQQLADRPYLPFGTGEGDWQANATAYRGGAVHMLQKPVYRLDGLDCQTLVQIMLALLRTKTLAEFDQVFVKIAYGAARQPSAGIIHYFNRNHFIDGDFNPINHKNGWLTDVTEQGSLAKYAQKISITLHRQNWFNYKQQYLKETIQVLDKKNGPAMIQRFTTHYAKLNFPHFLAENINMVYLPKSVLIIQDADGNYQANPTIFNNIPTPAVVEMVVNPQHWYSQRKKIEEAIGTELTVSHLGVLYRHTFQQGELIYRKITCQSHLNHQIACRVTPINCQKRNCQELMFVHATDAYPKQYYWYQKAKGDFLCSAHLPPAGVAFTTCNRVESLPLAAYLTRYPYGYFWYLHHPMLLGIHIEKINA